MYEGYPNFTEYVKVNFPSCERDFEKGYGESMRVLVEPETKAAYSADVEGGTWQGVLDNDSIYHPSLKHGHAVEFEMRGALKAVAKWDFLSQAAREGGYDPAENKRHFVEMCLAHAM